MVSSYFDTPLPHRLAHRGATVGGRIDENTLPAFEAALAQGATHIETDVHSSSDGIAVIFHDDDFARVGAASAVALKISELSAKQISQCPLAHGGQVSTLAEALRALPDTRFNIDVKNAAAARAIAKAVVDARAENRVLLTSFSDRRRLSALRAVRRLGGRRPATSAGAALTAAVLIGFCLTSWLGTGISKRVIGLLMRRIDALQVPTQLGPFRVARPALVSAVRAAGKHIHFWVINDKAVAAELLAMGASGLVSDDLAAIF